MRIRLTIVLLFTACSMLAQNPLEDLFSPENLKKAENHGVEVVPGARPGTAVLKFSPANPGGQPVYLFHLEPWRLAPGSLTVPVPKAGRDWTPHGALTFEFSSSSTITWELRIRNTKGQMFTFRVAPFQDVPVKVSIPLTFFTRQLLYNRQFLGYWLQNIDNHIDVTEVESLTFWMSPNRDVVLSLGPFALVSGEPSDEVFLNKPVVDAFGQWIPLEWPGKVHSVAELREAWGREDADLAKAEDFGRCEFGGWTARKERATGFFHTANLDGRWWLVDPHGHLFFSTGPDSARPRNSTRVKGREALFAELPPGSRDSVDFYRANTAQRYGETDYAARWKAKTVQRLTAWGFNTVANWADPALLQDPALPFVTTVSVGGGGKNWLGYPDVYSEKYAPAAEQAALANCARFRNEPKLIGYFIGNEPRFPYHDLIAEILNDPESSATQTFVRAFLKERGGTAASREVLLETMTRRYFQAVCDALRKADPNHINLGIRFSRYPRTGQQAKVGCAGCVQHQVLPEAVVRAADVFDVVSFNDYSIEPPHDIVTRIYRLLNKPMIIGEFHFGAPERGYAPGLVLVKNQTERGMAFQHYLENYAALPFVVGAHYFQLNDEPVAGRGDGENYGIGLVNELDIPYPEMVSFAKTTHRRLYSIHAGETKPARLFRQLSQ
jgi:hypothetical protein